MGSSKRSNLWGSLVVLPVTLAAALGVAACGGSDTGGSSNTAGSGGSMNSGGSTANAGNGSGGKTDGGASAMGGNAQAGNGQAGSVGVGGNNNGSGFSTGLPGDKPLNMLSDMELQTLCKKIADYYSSEPVATSLQQYTCSFSALIATAFSQPMSDAEARAACKMAYDSCAMEPLEPTSESCDKPSNSCTATIAEYEACQKDMLGYLAQLKDVFPACSEITLMDLEGGGSEDPMGPAMPASCQTVQQKCPDAPMGPSTMMP